MTRADLKAQSASLVTPLSVEIAGATVFNMPPPTQGVASLIILGLFDRLKVKRAESFEHIHGLIEAFGGAQAEDAAQRQAVLAKGITVAFYNTFFGLAIAVFCAIMFIILNGRQTLLLESFENAINRVRERIMERNKAIRARA